MSKIDMKGNPFFLSNSDIEWVNHMKESMTIEEKIGQLFVMIGAFVKEKELKAMVEDIKPGGLMFRANTKNKIHLGNKTLQKYSKIPMFLAANLEAGGNGLINEGTKVANNLSIAATRDENNAYELGRICATEAVSIGGNMAFAPVIDINYNWRNPITNIRSFGDDPDIVGKMGAAYVKGAKEAGCAVTIKHFPGDGIDGRDQHLVTTHNTLDYNKWMQTYGDVYKQSIEVGARGLMAGHITLPKYMEEKHPEAKEYTMMPATLNPYLLNNLLREELSYNGLIMTDASLMTGFGQNGMRKDLVPMAIAAGCDMFLFTRMPKDDYKYMMDGYKNGIITDERLDEALTRILALKASLKLHNKTREELTEDKFDTLDLKGHRAMSRKIADQAVTLVRNDDNLLPLDTKKYKKVGVVYAGNPFRSDALLSGIPGIKGTLIRGAKKIQDMRSGKKSDIETFVAALNKQGLSAFEYSFSNILDVLETMTQETLEKWKKQFDIIIYFSNVQTSSNQTSLQVNFKAMGFDAPWWVREIPTILISVGNPYQQYDFSMIKTVINGYTSSEVTYEAIAEKLVGLSKFKGHSPVNLDFVDTESISDYLFR